MLQEPSYIAWFKHTNDSLPLCIATQYVGEKPSDSIYLNGFEKNHAEMSVNKTFASLKIVNVDSLRLWTFLLWKFLEKPHDVSQQNTVSGGKW